LESTLLAPAVRPAVSTFLRHTSPVALADFSTANDEQSKYFGGQRIVGTAVDCSTLALVAHSNLHRSLEDRTPSAGRRGSGATSRGAVRRGSVTAARTLSQVRH